MHPSDERIERSLARMLQRHKRGEEEANIRSAFRDFLLETGLARAEDMREEANPGADSSDRVDLYVHNTVIEFKRNIMVRGAVRDDAIKQLDGYLSQLLESGSGEHNGILTDGCQFLVRQAGDDQLPGQEGTSQPKVFDRPQQAVRLREFLYDIFDNPVTGLAPTASNITRYFGSGSDLFRVANLLLSNLHSQHRAEPTVDIKRKLWRTLLQVALGESAFDDMPDHDWLFVRHTYLTSLVGLIVQAVLGVDVHAEAQRNPVDLLNGRVLALETNLHGVLDTDLFGWATEVGDGQHVRYMAAKVACFDWTTPPEDLPATLYQHIVTQEEREAMGEYYTPKWLARKMVQELVPRPADVRILDPACGSGTFLEAAIEHFLADAETQAMAPSERLSRLQTLVQGIDLHPVSVQLAKTNWILACAPVIRDVWEASTSPQLLAPPVYLGDSLQLRQDTAYMMQGETVTVHTYEYLHGGEDFTLPLSLVRDAGRHDNLMLALSEAVERTGDAVASVLNNRELVKADERTDIEAVANTLQRLHAEGRDHVWLYYLRNMVRPFSIAESGVDVVVGNPPWLTYKKSADIVRQELRDMSRQRYQIWAGGHQSPNQDFATLFYCRVIELYLRRGGVVGMVMPHSTLRLGQHLRFRQGRYEEKRTGRGAKTSSAQGMLLDFSHKVPWDLDHVDGAFLPSFPMPASVIFACVVNDWSQAAPEKGIQVAPKSLAPGQVEIWSGGHASAFERNAVRLIHDDGTFHSPYAAWSTKGATIYDRRLFFVTATSNERQFAPANTWRTNPATGSLDKKNYDASVLRDRVLHGDNLFDVYLGETLAPYMTLAPLKAVLPVDKQTMALPQTGAGTLDTNALDARMRDRWNDMAELWDANKGKNDTKSLLQRLDYNGSLSKQLEWLWNPASRPVWIAYTSSGEPTASLMHDREAIVDYTLFWVACRNATEAYYLLAIINSNALATVVKPFCPTNWAKKIRHLQKHLWKLPIPEFNEDNAVHASLSRLGRKAETEVAKFIRKLRTERSGELTTKAARHALRHEWQPSSSTAQAIETDVGTLLA